MKAILRHLPVAALVGTALAATACAPTVNTHGYRIDPAVVAQIQPGVTSREEVERLLGSPSSMSTFNDKSWYYVTQRTEQLTFYDTDVAAQDVLRIDFGGDGLVSNVNQRGLEMARNIAGRVSQENLRVRSRSFLISGRQLRHMKSASHVPGRWSFTTG